MSFGRKVEAAVRALQAEGKFPPGLRPGEASARILDRLKEQGHAPRELPHPRTVARYLDRFEQHPTRPACPVCPVCHVHQDVAGVICAPDNSEHEGDEDMQQAEPGALKDVAQVAQEFIVLIPDDHPIDAALAPSYLCRQANVGLRAGDGILLRATDFSWSAKLLVTSVIYGQPFTVGTKLVQPPTFPPDTVDCSMEYVLRQINEVERLWGLGKLSQAEFNTRMAALQKLRENGGRHPTAWLAAKLAELNRACDAGLLTRAQLAMCQQELLAALSETELDELNALVAPEKAKKTKPATLVN